MDRRSHGHVQPVGRVQLDRDRQHLDSGRGDSELEESAGSGLPRTGRPVPHAGDDTDPDTPVADTPDAHDPGRRADHKPDATGRHHADPAGRDACPGTSAHRARNPAKASAAQKAAAKHAAALVAKEVAAQKAAAKHAAAQEAKLAKAQQAAAKHAAKLAAKQ